MDQRYCTGRPQVFVDPRMAGGASFGKFSLSRI